MTPYEKTVDFWKNKNITDDALLFAALSEYAVSFTYHSGKIENDSITYNDTREIFRADGVVAYTGDLRTLYELKNGKEAYQYFLDAFGAAEPISENLICEFQKRLTMNTYDERRWKLGERPGEYKKHDYVTGKEEVGAAVADVRAEMSELIEDVQDVDDADALVAAAFFHAKFENIHPFADGNGRTGRILMNYILVSHNHPPIIIHQEDRRTYYEALQAWDERQSLDELVLFLKAQVVKTWEKQLNRKPAQCRLSELRLTKRDIDPE